MSERRPRLSLTLTPEQMSRQGASAVFDALYPSVRGPYDRFGKVLAAGSLGGRLRELVRLRNAGITGCEY